MRLTTDRRPRAPRRLLILFAIVTVPPTLGLVGLSWQILSPGPDRARQQLTDRLERESDTIAADPAHDQWRRTAHAGRVPLSQTPGKRG